jgi:hypothetical protein
MGLPHAAAKTTEATASEATEAATATPRRIAGTPTYGYAATRDAVAPAHLASGAPRPEHRVCGGWVDALRASTLDTHGRLRQDSGGANKCALTTAERRIFPFVPLAS